MRISSPSVGAVATVVGLTLAGLFGAGCSGSARVLDCPDKEPVVVEVPVPVSDSTATRLREFLRQQERPTMLNALDATRTTTDRIAAAALLEVYYWRRLMRDVLDMLGDGRRTEDGLYRRNEGQ